MKYVLYVFMAKFEDVFLEMVRGSRGQLKWGITSLMKMKGRNEH
jgi:hypothetical protein